MMLMEYEACMFDNVTAFVTLLELPLNYLLFICHEYMTVLYAILTVET